MMRAPSLLALAALLPACSRRPDVVLITLDTARADRFGCLGGPADLTPAVDALAREGVLFPDTEVTAPITLPSHASMLTGLYPDGHRVRDNSPDPLPSDVPTLAEALRARGWRTAAFVSGDPLHRRFGLARGFEVYDDAVDRPRSRQRGYLRERRGDRTVEQAARWLQTARGAVFLWVHLFDPHAPYEPPEPFASRFPGDPYAGELAFTDECVGRLFRSLRDCGRGDAVVAVLTDHGEGLGDHGEKTHQFLLQDSTARGLFLLRAPGRLPAGRVARGAVSPCDLLPTLLRIVDVAPIEPVDGHDLGADLERGMPADRAACSETLAGLFHHDWAPLRAVRQGSWRLVEGGGEARLFDLSRDPGETADRSQEEPGRVRALGSLLRPLRSRSAAPRADDPRRAPPGYAQGAPTATILARGPEELARLPSPAARLEVVEALEAAQVRLFAEQAAPARKALGTLAEREPRSPTVRFYLGSACRDDGRGDEERDPEKAQRSYEEALGHFSAVLERRPGHPGALNLSLWCLHKLGRFEEGRALAQAAVDDRRGDGDTHFWLGAFFSTVGAPFYDLARAERAALRALELDPTSVHARKLLQDLRGRRP